MTDLGLRFRWISVLRARAVTQLPSDQETASFPAPRHSVAKLCDIANAAVELVRLTDQEHDAHSPEGARAVKRALTQLVEAIDGK